MTDRFGNNNLVLSNPPTKVFAVTTSDSVDLTEAVRALYIGGAGNVELITLEGDTVVFSGLQAGQILPIRATRVKAGSTTATLILGLV